MASEFSQWIEGGWQAWKFLATVLFLVIVYIGYMEWRDQRGK